MGIENKEEAAPSPSLALTAREEKHIKKYRQLDADGQERIDRQIDFELYQQEQTAEKEELKLGWYHFINFDIDKDDIYSYNRDRKSAGIPTGTGTEKDLLCYAEEVFFCYEKI